jgi:aminoglycoside phosphotransferase (APT) family kinase protein
VNPLWPDRIQQRFESRYDSLLAVERLLGKSTATVWRLRFATQSVILKATTRPGEARFYEQVAPTLRSHAIPIPEVEFNEEQDGVYWLALEDIPHPLPRERWFCDREVVAVLKRLHRLPLALPALFQPQWTGEMTEKALACFPAEVAEAVRPRLAALQAQYQHLFEPRYPISGDPNPTNWGVRENGELVLFDWERFGYGTPALDLAITVPGLGNLEQFSQVAATYSPSTSPVEPLGRDIAAAKVWTVVEFLGHFADGQIADDATVKWIVEQFGGWVEGLSID